jgi:hypothetical protein
MSLRKFRPLALAATASLFAVIGAAPASAGLLVESAQDCNAPSSSPVFSPWVDYANYFHAPDGGFENGAQGWTLADGASVVSGNNSYNLSGAGSSSLRLPNGSDAVSPSVCVGLGEPTVRFVVKKTSGSLLSSLRVNVLVEDQLGVISELPIGVTGGVSSWQPSPPMFVVANLLPLIPGDQTAVAFRFVPQGGTWQIDDLYVDPTHKP